MQQLVHRLGQRQAVGDVLLAQAVDAHALTGHAFVGAHQQFQPLTGHDAVADDAHRAHRDDFVAAPVQPGGFAVQRHPFIGRWRVEQKGVLRIAQVVLSPGAFGLGQPVAWARGGGRGGRGYVGHISDQIQPQAQVQQRFEALDDRERVFEQIAL